MNIAAVDREYQVPGVVAEEWHHYCFVFTGEAAISYIDASEVADKRDRRGEIEYDGSPHFIIGERSAHSLGNPVGGLIDEVVLFSVDLDLDEILKVMDRGLSSRCSRGAS